MKKILFLLLFTSAIYAQTSTGQEQSFPYGIINESAQTVINPNTLVTHGADGTYGKASVNNIPISIAVQDSLNKKINLPTGFLQGLQLSINADPTKFNIAAGYYVVTDFTNLVQPVVKIITYPGATGLTPAYLATANSTYVALDINGNVISSAAPFTNADRRTLAIVGNVVHSNNTTINVTNEIKAPIVASTNQVHDFMRAIGFLNEEGNIYSPNGANLQINKSVGKIFGMGINSADYLNPHQLSIPAQTALTFAYRLRGGAQYANTTSIDPNNWDNAGVLTSVPVGNRWTIQRINLFQSGLTRIQYGQTVYTSYNDAVTALPTQSFVTEQNIADNAVFRCYLIVQQGTTNLASAVAAGTALFVPVDKFGNVIGSGSVALTYANIIATLGFTPENVANKVTDISTGANNTTYPTSLAVKTYADNLVVGMLNDRGTWDASANVFPTTGGSGTAGEIRKGDMWYVSVAGTLGGQSVNVGDSFRALVNTPAQVAANWSVLEANIGYVPANDANVVHLTGDEIKTGVLSFINSGTSLINGLNLVNNGSTGSYSFYSNNTSTGVSSYSTNQSTGVNYQINSTTASTGDLIQFLKNNIITGKVTHSGTGIFPRLSVNNLSSSEFNLSISSDRTGVFYADASQVILNAVKNVPLIFRTNDTERGSFSNLGVFKLNDLAGTGSRIVTADASGNLSAPSNITHTGTITSSGGFFNSDRRLKDIISRDGDVAYFKWKDGRDTKTHIGYIAQEVKKTNPDQVQKGEDGMLSVNYVEILVEKIQALEKRIKELERKTETNK